MRIKIFILLSALAMGIMAFRSGDKPQMTMSSPMDTSTRDSIVSCADSIYKKYVAGLREFNDMTYLGPYKPDSVKWLNLCGKGLGNKDLDGKLLNKMKNLQVLDLGYKDTYTIVKTSLNTEEPSEAKKKKLDREVAGGWEYYYRNRIVHKESSTVSRIDNRISALPKEMASLKKLKLLILCGNPIPAEEVTKLRKALPNTLIIFDN
jgi:hypothetical protein